MSAALVIATITIWGALVFYGEDAPLVIWKFAFLPLILVLSVALFICVRIGSFGDSTLDISIAGRRGRGGSVS